MVYVLVNTFLVVIWFVTNPHGFFWPIDDFGEEDVRREMARLER